MPQFRQAQPPFGDQMLTWRRRAARRVTTFLRYLADLGRLFSREGVLSYTAMVVILVIATGYLFAIVEHDQLKELGWLDKFVQGNYWAAITLMTVGYGDIVPKTVIGRVLTIVTVFLALGCVALFTATLTSALTSKKLLEGRGLTNAKDYSHHLLVLGWKREMFKLLSDMVHRLNPIAGRLIVIVADVDTETIEKVRTSEDLADIRVIRGRHYTEEAIVLGNPATAAGVLILADETFRDASDSEIDSKTVMASMILSKHVRSSHVVAELLDPSFEPYIRNTRVVDEIVFPRVYGMKVMGTSSFSVGVVNALNDLVDGTRGSRLASYHVPPEMVGRTFSELRSHFEREMPRALVIGLVENAGKYFERKSEAIREAQRTPDIDRLVENLQRVKSLAHNQPILNPPPDHAIQSHTLALVIEATER